MFCDLVTLLLYKLETPLCASKMERPIFKQLELYDHRRCFITGIL